MAWLILILAGFCEVGFTTCLGHAQRNSGNIAMLWWGGFAVTLTLSMYLLYKAAQSLPLGTAYAVWTGIGAVGTALIGIFVFKEPVTFWRLFFISTLVASVVGLKAVSE